MNEWIKTLILKRNALASNVVICTTTDDKRIDELLAYTQSHDIINSPRETTQNVIEADLYRGVNKVTSNKEGRVVRQAVNTEENLMDTDPAQSVLREITKNASTKRTVAVIRGIIRNNPSIDDFLNSVAIDDTFFNTESTIVVFVSDTSLINSTVLEKCIQLDVPLSTYEEREIIVRRLSKAYALMLSDQGVHTIADITSGMNLTNVESALLESYIKEQAFELKAIARAKSEAINRKEGINIELNGQLGFERVGGYAPLKKYVTENIVEVLQDRERAEALCLPLPKGMLLFGNPGTGKTTFGRAMANGLNLPFLELKASDLASKWYGESERKTRDILKTLDEIGRCVVFIDEIDALFPKRGAGATDNETTGRVFGMLLSYLGKERDSIIVGATNRPQDMDEASIRVGRFDLIAPMLLPDAEARAHIIAVHLNTVRGVPNSIDTTQFKALADKTKFFNGAELEGLVIDSIREAFRDKSDEVTIDHMLKALENIRVNIDQRTQEQAEYTKIAEEMTKDVDFLNSIKTTFNAPLTREELLAEKIR